jgi:glycosyltransferase involved in cell wall biosynthesis
MSTRPEARRIAFISTLEGSPWGGSEVLWSQTALRLRDAGHTVSANVPWWPQTPVPLEALESAGVLVTRRRERPRWKRILGAARVHERVFTWLDETRPEFVVLSLDSQTAGLDWMRACRARGLKYIPIVHIAPEHFWPGDPLNRELALRYQEAHGLFFVSERTRDFARRQFAHALPQAEIVRNPFNVPFDVDARWPEDESTLRLACVGRLDPATKGQDILFEVLREAKWRARPLHVTFFGDGGARESLEALRDFYGVQNAAFATHTPDVVGIWARHHALVLPSRSEGLPLVVVEAMLCARPCIVTDVGGSAELLEEGATGFIAPSPTPGFLDAALERAWEQRAHWSAMGELAARRVREQIPSDPAATFAARLLEL